MKTDQRYPRGVIAAVGRKVRAAIEPYVERSCYVGSFRRGLPTCGDLDILLIPKSDMYASPDVSRAFAALCVGGVLESGSGGELDIGTVPFHPSDGGTYGGVSVNLFYTDYENWGAALLYTTGSRDYNKACRAWARQNGYRLNQYGVFRGGHRIPDSGFSERAALRVLGLPWLPPNRRIGSAFGIERTVGA